MRGSRTSHTILFINYLRANNYISAQGVEYCAEEIDADYFDKISRKAESEADRLFLELFNDHQTKTERKICAHTTKTRSKEMRGKLLKPCASQSCKKVSAAKKPPPLLSHSKKPRKTARPNKRNLQRTKIKTTHQTIKPKRKAQTMTQKYLYGHTSPDTAFTVDNYPYGFRLRTQIRYWIESKDAKNGGQRFVSQTINPKTGRWNKPKAGTYSPVLVMREDTSNGYISCVGLNRCVGDKETADKIKEFLATHGDNLTDFQKKQAKIYYALNKAYSHVTYSFAPVKRSEPVSLSEIARGSARVDAMIEAEDKRHAQQKETQKKIGQLANYYYKTI